MMATKPKRSELKSEQADDTPVIQSARSLFSAMLRGSHGNRALLIDAIAHPTKRRRAEVEEWYVGTSLPEPHEVPAIACAIDASPAHVAVIWMMNSVPQMSVGLAALASGEEFERLERVITAELLKGAQR